MGTALMEPLTVGPEGDVFVGRFGGGLRWWFHYLRKRFLDKIHKMDKILRRKLTRRGRLLTAEETEITESGWKIFPFIL